ncbi:PPOX class F420-dependent oxidoreductase [Nonomuraea sp. NPDC048881]|uniref:PPOX class F420-dependent oxidoreductase n=1 Tax=Nonomuraea sp. NPDC048881 TaxID=3155030 RepID=UPI0033F56A5A
MVFTNAELDYLTGQRLGRLATVSATGQVQNNTVNFFVDADSGTIIIGGHALGASKKFRNVQRGSAVSFVVDDLTSVHPWVVRGIEIRGSALALTEHEPPCRTSHGRSSRSLPRRSSLGAGRAPIEPRGVTACGGGGGMETPAEGSPIGSRAGRARRRTVTCGVLACLAPSLARRPGRKCSRCG